MALVFHGVKILISDMLESMEKEYFYWQSSFKKLLSLTLVFNCYSIFNLKKLLIIILSMQIKMAVVIKRVVNVIYAGAATNV
jgi:hypothetical protein